MALQPYYLSHSGDVNVRLLVATGVLAELGDLNRFGHLRKLKSYFDLAPSEHSSEGKRHIGAINQ
jgi:transposase